MHIKIKTDTTALTIELANTPFAKQWGAYARNLTKDNFYVTRPWSMMQNENLERAKTAHDNLVECIDYVSKHITDYNWCKTKDAVSAVMQDRQQKHCNTIHRAFTFMVLKGHLSTFYTQELDKQVHIINSAIHELESFYTYQQLETRKQFNGQVQQVLFTDAGNMEDKDFSMWNTPITETFDHNTQDINYDVWLNEDILGKDLVRCFLDNDDPNNPDITGNLFLTPSLYVDIDRIYSKVLNSSEFNEWHQRLCPNKTLDRYPIGNVIKRNGVQVNLNEPVKEYSFE